MVDYPLNNYSRNINKFRSRLSLDMSQIFVEAHVHRQRVQYLYVGLVFDVCTFAFLAAFLLFSWCCVVCLGITFNKSVTCVG